MARSAMTTAPRRVTAEARSRVFPSSRDLRYGATSPLHSRGVPREALDARHDLPERGPCQVAFKGRRRSRAPAGRRRTTTTTTTTTTLLENYRPRRLGVLIPQPCVATHGCGRSEEHTSELQSRPHLVCR